MKIESVNFGELDVPEEELFVFDHGLYGLEECRRYALVQPDETLPFAYLMAVDFPEVCLLVADPFAFRQDYEFDLPDADIEGLQQPQPGRLSVWVTVSIRDSMQTATMNLLAPIVLNREKRLGRQVVLQDSSYQTKMPLFPQKEGK